MCVTDPSENMSLLQLMLVMRIYSNHVEASGLVALFLRIGFMRLRIEYKRLSVFRGPVAQLRPRYLATRIIKYVSAIVVCLPIFSSIYSRLLMIWDIFL